MRTKLRTVSWMALGLAACGGGDGQDASVPGLDASAMDATSLDAGEPMVPDSGRDATGGEDAPSLVDSPPGLDSPPELDARATASALHGYAQKGPFLPGSRVTVIGLDDLLYPTGATYLSETYGSLGEYDVGSLAAGLYQVEVTGRTRPERAGSGPTPEITLRAIAAADDDGMITASVTAVTHLTTPRIRELVRDGTDLDDARLQAETELRVSLDVTLDAFDPGPIGTAVWVTAPDSPAVRFLAVVSLLVGDGEDLDLLADELRDDGAFETATRDAFHAMLTQHASLDEARESALYPRWASFWVSMGLPGDPPDIREIMDSDGDGLSDAADNCVRLANPDGLDSDGDDGDDDGDVCDITPMGECPPGITPLVYDGRMYCDPTCGSATCPMDSACSRVGPFVPGSVCSPSDESCRCWPPCDITDRDPCPDGSACMVGYASSRVACIPHDRTTNVTFCSGSNFGRDCIDGYACMIGRTASMGSCQKRCDLAAPDCATGACTADWAGVGWCL